MTLDAVVCAHAGGPAVQQGAQHAELFLSLVSNVQQAAAAKYVLALIDKVLVGNTTLPARAWACAVPAG
jgi:hypothetical protein